MVQITPGVPTVGAEVTGPAQSGLPPAENGVTVPPVLEASVPPVAAETPVPAPAPELSATPVDESVPISVGTPPPEPPIAPEVDPVAEAAALGEARGAIGADAAPVVASETVSVAPLAPVAPVDSAVSTVPIAEPVSEASNLTDEQAVHNVLTNTGGNPAAAAAALEAGVQDNHLVTEAPAEDGDIAEVAAADAAAQELGPEPVPAPPEAAFPISSATSDNLVGAETQAVPPVVAPVAEPVIAPMTAAPDIARPRKPFVDTAFYPSPMRSQVAQGGEQQEAAIPKPESKTSPENIRFLRDLQASLDGDVDQLRRWLDSMEGRNPRNPNETKAGESQ